MTLLLQVNSSFFYDRHIPLKRMAKPSIQLSILVQPQLAYRERYISELDPRRNRAQRFIRTDQNPFKLDYPTIEVKLILNVLLTYLFIT